MMQEMIIALAHRKPQMLDVQADARAVASRTERSREAEDLRASQRNHSPKRIGAASKLGKNFSAGKAYCSHNPYRLHKNYGE